MEDEATSLEGWTAPLRQSIRMRFSTSDDRAISIEWVPKPPSVPTVYVVRITEPVDPGDDAAPSGMTTAVRALDMLWAHEIAAGVSPFSLPPSDRPSSGANPARKA
jgi:hypothetical protein